MMLPNAWARHHGQGTPGTRSLPRINKQASKYYAPTADVFPPVTSGGTTAMAKGGLTHCHRKEEQETRQKCAEGNEEM